MEWTPLIPFWYMASSTARLSDPSMQETNMSTWAAFMARTSAVGFAPSPKPTSSNPTWMPACFRPATTDLQASSDDAAML